MWGDDNWIHVVEVWLLVGATGSLEASSLDLSAGHSLAKESLTPKEKLVVVAARIRASCQSREAVKIELALEGSKF